MSSSSKTSRNCTFKSNLPVRPATDPIWSEEGYDDYEFGHVATWETPLKNKEGLQTGKFFIWFQKKLKTGSLICLARVLVEIFSLGIGTAWRTDELKLDHEVNKFINYNLISFKGILNGNYFYTIN